MIFSDIKYDEILCDAFYKSQDPRDLTRIQIVLKKIADYEKTIIAKTGKPTNTAVGIKDG